MVMQKSVFTPINEQKSRTERLFDEYDQKQQAKREMAGKPLSPDQQIIMDYLNTGKRLSVRIGLLKLGISAVSQQISKLKLEHGKNIICEPVTVENSRGRKCRITAYSIAPDHRE